MDDEEIEYTISIDPDTVAAAAKAGYTITVYTDGQVRFMPPKNGQGK